MTKNDLADKLCVRSNLSKSEALHAIETLTGILIEAFEEGENLYLRGFGTMEVVQHKAKKARNINAGTELLVPAFRSVKFKISNQLKKRINDGTMD